MELCLQFLGACSGGASAPEETEKNKKNAAIDKQISKSKAALRKEQKILLLGTERDMHTIRRIYRHTSNVKMCRHTHILLSGMRESVRFDTSNVGNRITI
jgi:hypothetical protein